MTEQEGSPQSPHRAKRAWETATAEVAERNKQARRVGKQRREAHERRQADLRNAEERRAMSELLDGRRAR